MVIKDATKSLYFRITMESVEAAREAAADGFDGESRGNCCVIAQAMTAALGDFFVKVEVGPAITKVFTRDGRCLRYGTPKVLRDGLSAFDNSIGRGGSGTSRTAST